MMRNPAVTLVLRLLAAVFAAVSAIPVAAQGWPSKPLRLIVPSPPGDGSDLMARAVGAKLSEVLGQQVVVDNRPGAGGRLGTELAAKATPDGYTFIMGNAGSHAINSALYKDLPYDIERDFVAVTQVMRAPNVLVVNASLPVTSVRELIALYKANPGKYSYGSGGNGSSAHLSAELFKSMAGVDVLHVPYKGATPALTDLIAGQVAMFMGNLPPAMGHIKAGRVKALAVTTAQRSTLVPDIPTVAESGLPGFETVAWFGIFAPTGTPREIVQRLADETAKVVQRPDIREAIATLGGEPVGNSPAAFAAIVKGDLTKWRNVVNDANVKVD
ncbi:MAG TPA: tripartite tricarboxylate transporter substrate binding protein [Casimicrobiaceae bacterium]|nr:tripartite tricarboxylate transporter substrate binding protein [Casimicrobiaceae bacterium]